MNKADQVLQKVEDDPLVFIESYKRNRSIVDQGPSVYATIAQRRKERIKEISQLVNLKDDCEKLADMLMKCEGTIEPEMLYLATGYDKCEIIKKEHLKHKFRPKAYLN